MVSVSCGLARVGRERTAPVIIDCCLFAGGATESLILELRMRTLADVVDLFMVVSCTRTHQDDLVLRGDVDEDFLRAGEAAGVRARLFWVEPQRVMERNGRFLERAEGDRGGVGSPYYQFVERQHRDGMRAAVETITSNPDVVVCMSDVDEIPRPEAVIRAAQMLEAESLWIVCEQRMHSTYLDALHPVQPWLGTCISRLSAMEPQALRDARTTVGTDHQAVVTLPDAGIHGSWLGTDDDRQRKLDTFSHAELRSADPAEWRRSFVHANREPLVAMSIVQQRSVWWPKPLLDGTFPCPDGWLSEHAWES